MFEVSAVPYYGNNMVLKLFLFCHRPVVIVEMTFIVDGIWTTSSGNSSSSMFVAHCCDTLKTVSANHFCAWRHCPCFFPFSLTSVKTLHFSRQYYCITSQVKDAHSRSHSILTLSSCCQWARKEVTLSLNPHWEHF